MYDSLTFTSINDEPRVRDSDLARVLGYAEVHDLRQEIGGYWKHLAKLGPVVSEDGESIRAYDCRSEEPCYLNRQHAQFLTLRCDNPEAFPIVKLMIQAYVAIGRGQTPAVL